MNERILTPEEKASVDHYLEIIKTVKAGPERVAAVQGIGAIAKRKSQAPITSLRHALLVLDYIEPSINKGQRVSQELALQEDDAAVEPAQESGIQFTSMDEMFDK